MITITLCSRGGVMNKRGFLMTTDAILAFIIISFSVVITHQFLISKATFERSYLHSVTSDAAALIEDSMTENIPEILNIAPNNICLKSLIITYKNNGQVQEKTKVTKGCPQDGRSDTSISRRTYLGENKEIIIVYGWYKT